MMRAIRLAAAEGALFKGTTLTNGLRAIRCFEQVNAQPFDPFDKYHVSLVTGMGVHAGIFRRLELTPTPTKEQRHG